jgi:hypothetical protein
LPIRFSGPLGDFEVENGYIAGRPCEPDPNLVVAESVRDGGRPGEQTPAA